MHLSPPLIQHHPAGSRSRQAIEMPAKIAVERESQACRIESPPQEWWSWQTRKTFWGFCFCYKNFLLQE